MYKDLASALKGLAKPKKEGGGAHDTRRINIINSLLGVLENPPTSLIDSPVEICWLEENILGISLTCQKIDGCDTSEVNTTCKEIREGRTGFMLIGVEITGIRETKTKNGKSAGSKMAFVTVSDATCSLDNVVAFPNAWKEYSKFLSEGSTVLIQGEVKNDSFVIEKVWPAKAAQ
jgi:DNA polymerase III alpha subunit